MSAKIQSKVKTKDLPPGDDPVVAADAVPPDVPVDEPVDVEPEVADNGPAEPYGAQILRRFHEILSILMKEGDEILGPLEHQEVKEHITEVMQSLESHLSGMEKAFKKHYKDLPELEGTMDEEELTETGRDMDEVDPAVVEADSQREDELPTPDEVVEGMQTKSIKGKWKVKSVCPACEEAGKENCTCDDKSLKAETKAIDQPGVPGNEEHQEKPGHDETKEDVVEEKAMAVEAPSHPIAKSLGLSAAQKSIVSKAMKFLKDISEDDSYFDDEDRMKAYHVHKLLDFNEDEGKEKKDKALPGTEEWEQEEANEPEHMKMCKHLASFLKSLAFEKAFGNSHRHKAKYWHRAMEPVIKEDDDGLEHENKNEVDMEKETFEPGELGEKDFAEMRKQLDENDREMEELNRKMMSLAF